MGCSSSDDLWGALVQSQDKLSAGDTLAARQTIARTLSRARVRAAWDSAAVATLYARIAYIDYRRGSPSTGSGYYADAYPFLEHLSDSLHGAVLTWSGTAALEQGDSATALRYFLEAYHRADRMGYAELAACADSLRRMVEPMPIAAPPRRDVPLGVVVLALVVCFMLGLIMLIPPRQSMPVPRNGTH